MKDFDNINLAAYAAGKLNFNQFLCGSVIPKLRLQKEFFHK
jgi:hypothetical protein